MPNFASNVFMCWLMGVSVGGLIPVAVSLLSEVTHHTTPHHTRTHHTRTHRPPPPC
jgi:hypothetical protein